MFWYHIRAMKKASKKVVKKVAKVRSGQGACCAEAVGDGGDEEKREGGADWL